MLKKILERLFYINTLKKIFEIKNCYNTTKYKNKNLKLVCLGQFNNEKELREH
jgi:hypothetical protein